MATGGQGQGVYTRASQDTFDSIYDALKGYPTPLLPPGKAHNAAMTDRIASLYVHPSLEALLHIMNLDLPSSHFLVRHMQAAPQIEGMYTHGLLHRVEGDYDNCRAWYADVCSSDSFTNFWGTSATSVPDYLGFLPEDEVKRFGGEVHDEESGKPEPHIVKTPAGGKLPSQIGARVFLSAIQDLKARSTNSTGYTERKAKLEHVSELEIEALVKFCTKKYGSGKVEDASKIWVQPGEEHRKMGEDMVSGGKGHREF